jgi:hypothetical protein
LKGTQRDASGYDTCCQRTDVSGTPRTPEAFAVVALVGGVVVVEVDVVGDGCVVAVTGGFVAGVGVW